MSKQTKQSQPIVNNDKEIQAASSNGDTNKEPVKFRIKVCGMTLPEQVNALDEMGVDLSDTHLEK